MFRAEDLNAWTEKGTAMIAHNITVTATYQNLEARYQRELIEEFEKYQQIKNTPKSDRQLLIEKTLWYQMMNCLRQIQAEYGPFFSKMQCDPNRNEIIFNPIAGANCYTVGLCLTEIPDEIPELECEFTINGLSEINFFWEYSIDKLALDNEWDGSRDFTRKILLWYLAAIDTSPEIMKISTVCNRLKSFASALHDCLRAGNILERDCKLTEEELIKLETIGKSDPFRGATDNGKKTHTACPEGFRVKFCERFFTLHPSNVFVADLNYNEMAREAIEQALQANYLQIDPKTSPKLKKWIEDYHDIGGFPKASEDEKEMKDAINAFEKSVMDSAVLNIDKKHNFDPSDLMLFSIGQLDEQLRKLHNACELIGMKGLAMMEITYAYNSKKEENTLQSSKQEPLQLSTQNVFKK